MRDSLILTVLLLLVWPAAARDPQPLIGRATVIDGDTLEVRGQRVRLWGIDAPEAGQTCHRDGREWQCGQRAAMALAELIGQRPIACLMFYQDRWQRAVGTCRLGTEDIGAWLVRNGWAVDWPRFSAGFYEGIEREAQRESRGIWQGEFDLPWEWR